jgi:hypothetical protein
MEDLEDKAQREQEQRLKDHIFRAESRIVVLESALKWLATRLERPGGTGAQEWIDMAMRNANGRS